MGIETAILGGAALLGVGADIYSSNKATSSTENAANSANAIQWEMYKQSRADYQQSRADMAPWRAAGENALNTLVSKANAGPGEFQESPSYQFALSEGQKGIERMASATGRLGSGASLKAAGRYAENLASQEYGNFLNRYYQSLTPYQSLAGVGQTAASQTGQNAIATGQNAIATGQSMGQNTLYAGQAQAQNYLNTGNAIANFAQGAGQTYLDYNALNKYKQPTYSMYDIY